MTSRFCLAIGRETAWYVTTWQERLAPLFPVVSMQEGAALFCENATDAIALPSVDGWIVGKLFRAADSRPVSHIETHQQLAVASTGGRSLLAAYFGSYVAIWRNGPDRPWCVMRDPSATQPVLFHSGSGLTLIASDLEALEAFGHIRTSIDWTGIAHNLCYPQVPTARTGIEGVTELLPGQRMRLDADAPTTEQIWQPWAFRNAAQGAAASRNRIKELESVVDRVVAAWAFGVEQIGLELSGGLDSSILSAALDGASAHWTGFTFATRAADGDERRYARMVTDTFAAPLIEAVVGDNVVIALDTLARRTERPGGTGFLAGLDRTLQALGDAVGADAFLSGAGGDNVFCSIGSTAPIIDAWQVGGLALARRAFADVATTSGSTHWQVGRSLALRWIRDSLHTRNWPPNHRFLNRDVRPAPDRHPWLALPAGTPPGLRAHIAAVLRIHMVLTAHDRFCKRRYVFPLLSQPVLEACLAIPSWQWLAGGRDRAVARAAFADRLPPAVVARTKKGRVESLMVRAYDRARPELTATLRDGLLHGAGLLDMPTIVDCLREPATGGPADYARILALVDAELLARTVLTKTRS